MPTVTLSTKVYNDFLLRLVDDLLKSMLKGLKVDVEIHGITPRRRIQIHIFNEDQKVALRYLADEIGLCPTLLKNVERFSTITGYVSLVGRKELEVDIGISSPSIIDAALSIQCLQTQLADGRKVALKRLTELFSLCENFPLTIKICAIDKENNHIEATLSEKQLTLYKNWTRSLLDRLIVLGASFNEVTRALKQAKCNRDVVNIEPLGLFEHAIVCKLGTDAKGLIPKIGKKLRSANFSIFNPRKILGFLGDYLVL